MWTVTAHHHCKDWRNGDLEDKFELIAQENFKIRNAGKDWIESKLKYKSQDDVQRFYHKGDEPSKCYYWTGMTWIHENTGEEMQEYYVYTLKRANIH